MKSITPLELAKKYLEKLGMSSEKAQITLLPSLFKENILFTPMKTHNLVVKNKALDRYTQTHIHIAKSFWPELYSPAQITDYSINHSNTYEEKQNILIIEANIASLLERRSKRITSSIEAYSASGSYKTNSFTLIEASTNKHFATQGSSDQVHIGLHDSSVFKDFRHGILLDDCLLILRYAKKDYLLAICIPSEFCSRYSVITTKKINRNKSDIEQNKYLIEDGNYTRAANETITPEVTPLKPQQPQKGTSRNSSSKPKFTGKASRGIGALEKAGYMCEWNPKHTSFVSEKTSKPYMEPHHLIPISRQNLYKYDIDITPNLICLCPNCHKMIHYGKKHDVEEMLSTFYASRYESLKKSGIDLDKETLFAYYDIF